MWYPPNQAAATSISFQQERKTKAWGPTIDYKDEIPKVNQ